MIPAINVWIRNGQTIHWITSENVKKHILTDEAIETGVFPERGYYVVRENDGWTAIDNSDGNAWCEDFETLDAAKRWLIP